MLLQDILRTFFFTRHKPMMAAFLASVGIAHEDCSIHLKGIQPPSESDLQTSVARLLY
jgi:hypothetical protein